VGDSTRDTFIDGMHTRFVPLVLALDRSVLAAVQRTRIHSC
jgi:hypothetical protein